MAHETRPERIISEKTIDVQGGEVVLPNAGVPTQVSSPRQATKRTVAAVVAALAVILPIVNAALVIVQEELSRADGLSIPAWFWVGLNAAIALVAAVSGIVTRILAIPRVNEWIVASLPWLSPEPVARTED